MSESAWVDADTLLVAHFDTRMGMRGAYDTLKVRQVKATILRDAAQWGQWYTAGNLPTVVVESRLVQYAPGPHGNGVVNVDSEYQYTTFAIVDGDEDTVVTDAKVMLKRMIKALRVFSADVVVDDGEYIRGLPRIRGGGVIKVARPGSNNQWFGVALVDFSLGRLR